MFSETGNPVGGKGNNIGTAGPVSPKAAPFAWLRPLPFLLLTGFAFHGFNGRPAPATQDTQLGVALDLAEHFGLSASPSDVVWIDAPPPWSKPFQRARAWVLAQRSEQNNDVYLAHVRRSPEGAVLHVDSVFNVTDTSAADESHFRAAGPLAGYAVGNEGRSYSVHLLHANRGPQLNATWNAEQRWQQRLTFWQELGQPLGVLRRHFKLDPTAEQLWLGIDSAQVQIFADGHRITLSDDGDVKEGGRYVAERPEHVAQPGNLVTWAVDRARGFRWFGDEKMQWLKAVAYRGLDLLRVSLADIDDTPADEPEALTVTGTPTRIEAHNGADRAAGANRNWPPPALVPLLDPALPEEGQWQDLAQDPFVLPLPDGSSPLLTTLLRTDPEREFSSIAIVLWDSDVLELSMQSGTEEPKTATGEHGSGLIPRDPAVLQRLVGAFNGGFQGTHGDFGMMVEGVLYVPPKPFAATVARLSDGNSAFGTWPLEGEIPTNIVSFRQNLTALVIDGTLNPYQRQFWGGAPEGWEDRTRTVRSGLCLTSRGHLAYLYGASVDHVALGRAMQQLDCTYGMHLDMNQGHTGFEFYRSAPAAELPTLSMPLSAMWQAEGEVVNAPGYRFRGRRLFKTMQLMNFPRYIQREARDFFYLTQKYLLPSRPLQLGDAPVGNGEGAWAPLKASDGNNAFPYAAMRASLRPLPAARPETKVHAIELDPKRLARASSPSAALFSIEPVATSGSSVLRFGPAGFSISPLAEHSEDWVLASGSDAPQHGTIAAFGIRKDSGFLLYLEVGTAADAANDGALLRDLLLSAGCAQQVYLAEPLRLALADHHDLSGRPLLPTATAQGFVRIVTPGAQRIFKETPIVGPDVWRPLQKKRPETE